MAFLRLAMTWEQAYESLLKVGASPDVDDNKGRAPIELTPLKTREEFLRLEARYGSAGGKAASPKGKKAKKKSKQKAKQKQKPQTGGGR
jgi:hypothetical protein